MAEGIAKHLEALLAVIAIFCEMMIDRGVEEKQL